MSAISNGGEPAQIPDDLDEQLSNLAPRLEERLKGLDRERNALAAQHRKEREALGARQRSEIAAVERRRRTYEGMLKALGVGAPPTRTTGRQPGTTYAPPGPHILIPMIEAFLTREGLFSALDVHRQEGWTWVEPTTYAGISYLKSIEFLGRTGQRDSETRRELYRVLDRGVGERLLADLKDGKKPAKSPLAKKPHRSKGDSGLSEGGFKDGLGVLLRVSRETGGAPVSIRSLRNAGLSKHRAHRTIVMARQRQLIVEAGRRMEAEGGQPSLVYSPKEAEIEELINA